MRIDRAAEHNASSSDANNDGTERSETDIPIAALFEADKNVNIMLQEVEAKGDPANEKCYRCSVGATRYVGATLCRRTSASMKSLMKSARSMIPYASDVHKLLSGNGYSFAHMMVICSTSIVDSFIAECAPGARQTQQNSQNSAVKTPHKPST